MTVNKCNTEEHAGSMQHLQTPTEPTILSEREPTSMKHKPVCLASVQLNQCTLLAEQYAGTYGYLRTYQGPSEQIGKLVREKEQPENARKCSASRQPSFPPKGTLL